MQAARLVAVLPLCLAGAAGAVTVDREFHESFEVAPGAVLELRHGDGDVSITPWDREVIDVHVRYHAELTAIGIGTQPDFDVAFSQSGNTVRVEGREIGRRGIGFFTSREREHRYTVRAPAWVRLDLEGDDGDVVVKGWRADLDLEIDDGDVRLEDFQADARLEAQDGDVVIAGFAGDLSIRLDDGDVTASDCRTPLLRLRAQDGNVDIDRCEGDFEISLDDGDLRMARLTAGALKVRAEDGSVDIELAAAAALDLDVVLDDGDVDLRLADGISATFSIETDDGSIRVTPESRVTSRTRHLVSGSIGDGAGRIRIQTADGDVTLR